MDALSGDTKKLLSGAAVLTRWMSENVKAFPPSTTDCSAVESERGRLVIGAGGPTVSRHAARTKAATITDDARYWRLLRCRLGGTQSLACDESIDERFIGCAGETRCWEFRSPAEASISMRQDRRDRFT
jgi:hypothetical protein